jgi:hypothetical protein
MRYANRILEDGKQMYKITDLAGWRKLKSEWLLWEDYKEQDECWKSPESLRIVGSKYL